VELRFKCQDLPSNKTFIEAFVYVGVGKQQTKSKFVTDVVKYSKNPSYMEPLIIDFNPEKFISIEFFVKEDQRDGVLIGKTKVDFNDIMNAPNARLQTNIENVAKKIVGTLIIDAEFINTEGDDKIALKFYGSNLDKKDLFSKSDPYLVINQLKDNVLHPVAKTEVIENNLNPHWKELTITLQKLCNCDLKKPLLIECYDYDSGSKDDLIGTFETIAENFFIGATPQTYCLSIEKKKGKVSCSGKITLESCRRVNAVVGPPPTSLAAKRATLTASKIQETRSGEQPMQPVQPEQLTQPVQPVQPVQPAQPAQTAQL